MKLNGEDADILRRAESILSKILSSNDPWKKYIDGKLSIPKIYHGKGEIKLIVLGQDPTVKREDRRKLITTVLNLDKDGSLEKYLNKICKCLGLCFEENVYATNVIKNFFIDPPTVILKKTIVMY